MAEIHPAIAAELYGNYGEVEGWTYVTAEYICTSRWQEWSWMVLKDQEGAFWGVEYGVGLTECQEDDLPWRDYDNPIRLTRLYPREVTTTRYDKTPVKVASARDV